MEKTKAIFIRTWHGENYVLENGKVKLFDEKEAKRYIKKIKSKNNILKAKIVEYKL